MRGCHLKRLAKAVILPLCFAFAVCAPASARQSATYAETHSLLRDLQIESASDGKLARLFRDGDERIEDLIRALDDRREEVSRNAQIVIRYLGNDADMNALIQGYGRKNEFAMYGAVPLPLRAWDYELIKTHLP